MRRGGGCIALLLSLLVLAAPSRAQTPQPSTPPPSPTPVATPSPAAPGTAPTPVPTAETVPAPPTTAPAPPAPGDPSLTRSIGLVDPICQEFARASTEQCRRSGAVFRSRDISHYGLDAFDTSIGVMTDNPWDAFIQETIVRGWSALLWLLNAALTVLEYGYMLDPINESMAAIGDALDTLHNDVLGEPWFLAALSVLGLWGIWNGLVRLRMIETIGGTVLAVLLMVIGLWIISDPKETVGRAAHMSNQAAMSVLSVTTTGDMGEPSEGLAASTKGLFDRIVIEPWCALQFGDVAYCMSERAGRRTADTWLAHPARSGKREAMYRYAVADDSFWSKVKARGKEIATGSWVEDQIEGQAQLSGEEKDAVGKDVEKMAMLEPPGATTRLGLAALIFPGVFAAFLLIGWLGLKQIQAGFWALVLLMFFPFFLFAPAFGEAGRTTFLEALKRLFSAIAYVLLGAVMLAAVTIVVVQIGNLGGPETWMRRWLLTSGFLLTVFLKRNELLTFMSMGALKPDPGRLPSVLSAYAGWRLFADATKLVTAPTRAAARGLQRQHAISTDRAAMRRDAQAAATQDGAAAALDQRADAVLRQHDPAARTAALETVEHGERSRRRVDEIDELEQGGRVSSDLHEDRRRHQEFLDSDRLRHATTKLNDGSFWKPGPETTQRQRDAWTEARRKAIEKPPDHDDNLRAIGFDRTAYERATPGERARLVAASQTRMDRDRALFDAVPTGGGRASDATLDRAAAQLDQDELRMRFEAHDGQLRDQDRRRIVRDRARSARRRLR